MAYKVLNATAIRETEAALLVEAPEFDHAEWIPKGQIDQEESEVMGEDDEGTLVVSEWFAEKKGWV
jgi:hypothetical protein